MPTLACDEKYRQVVRSHFFAYFGVSKECSGQCPLTATLSQFVVTGKLCRACSPTQISHFSRRSSSNKASHCRTSQRCERGHEEQMRKLSSRCGGKGSGGSANPKETRLQFSLCKARILRQEGCRLYRSLYGNSFQNIWWRRLN